MKYVALLRGIGPMNPNMRSEKLRGVVESLGFGDVQTVISTGNVVFEAGSVDAGELETLLQAAWPDQLGFESMTILRSRDQIEQFLDSNPFRDYEETKATSLQVTFLKYPPHVDLEIPYTPESGDYTVVSLDKLVACSVVDLTGSRTPDLMRWLEKTFGKAITTRTWKSVHRIWRKLA